MIGEAALYVPETVREEFDDITWSSIIGMRSVLIHEYFGVDYEILWETIRVDLPTLAPLLKSALQEDAD